MKLGPSPSLSGSPAIASGRLLADLSRKGLEAGQGGIILIIWGGLSEQEEWVSFSLFLVLSLAFPLSSFPQASLQLSILVTENIKWQYANPSASWLRKCSWEPHLEVIDTCFRNGFAFLPFLEQGWCIQ